MSDEVKLRGLRIRCGDVVDPLERADWEMHLNGRKYRGSCLRAHTREAMQWRDTYGNQNEIVPEST